MWGMRLNQYQVPASQGQSNAIVDQTQHTAAVTVQDIQSRGKTVGIQRISGCYIHRANVELNGVPMEGTTSTILADSNSTTCVVRITINPLSTVAEDQLVIRCNWKSGNNPLGIVAHLEEVVEVQNMG